MNAEIRDKLDEIRALCEQHGIARLEVFGSAARDDFNPASSDVDFLVEFRDTREGTNYGYRFLDFADALEAVLGRRVDLLTERSVRNPYLRKEIERDRKEVFVAQHPTAAD